MMSGEVLHQMTQKYNHTNAISQPEGTGRLDTAAHILNMRSLLSFQPQFFIQIAEKLSSQYLEARDDTLAPELLHVLDVTVLGHLHL